MSGKLKGTVKWFENTKGYGFIQSDGKDYFVHCSGIISDGHKSLSDGVEVLFKIVEGRKGVQAGEVEVVDAMR